LLLTFCATLSAGAASFSGRWSLDPARSQGNPPGLEQTLVIEQAGETLKVATSLITDNVDRITTDEYVLGGGERDFPPQQPGITVTSAKRTARRTGERSFESTDRIAGTNPGGPVDLVIERTWTLSDDGKTLTVDQAVTNSGFTTRSKRVLVSGSAAAAAAASARNFPVDLTVPFAPTAFSSGGKTQLVYELHVTNFRAGEVEWKRLEVLGDGGQPLASYEGAELDALLTRPGLPGAKDVRRIGAGMRAMAFLWVPVNGAAPRELRHRVAFTIPASASGNERIVESAPLAVKSAPIVIGPPVRGGAWIARWVSNTSFHRRAVIPVDGRPSISQRFAIDWSRFDAKGVEWVGEGKKNEEYAVYGQEVIAVADGTIAEVVTDLPENTPGSVNPAVQITLDTAAGNHVSLQLPDGTFATYAHLQGPSITVKKGQRVRRGEVLGRVGNSGNAVGPHLHFHVATAPGLEGEGLPYVFDTFELVGLEEGAPDDGKLNGKTMTAEAHRREMPSEHMLVKFGGEQRASLD
jgi:murein DD-endopeptidase MepM/ murein hydrolase activator NlpD